VTATCAWCSAPRGTGDTCPGCGANYEKAEAIKSSGRAAAIVHEPQAAVEDVDSADLGHAEETPDEWKNVWDPELERKFCLAAIPVALVLAVMFNVSSLGHALQRMFLTMPVHELGHAVTAWFCGFGAIPTLWKTVVFDGRGLVAPLALAGAIGYMTYRTHQAGKQHLVYAGCALILLQGIGTLGIGEDTALMLISFGGDGAGMILATLMMASFFGKNTQLYKGSVRWGLVVIGAAAFTDMYGTWWRARNDDQAIPYGTTGGMASDAMTLMDGYGWAAQTLVNRYLVLGACCLAVLALAYAWGVRRAAAEIEARRLKQAKADRARQKREGR